MILRWSADKRRRTVTRIFDLPVGDIDNDVPAALRRYKTINKIWRFVRRVDVVVPWTICCADNWPNAGNSSPRGWRPGPTVRDATSRCPWLSGWTAVFGRRFFWTTAASHTSGRREIWRTSNGTAHHRQTAPKRITIWTRQKTFAGERKTQNPTAVYQEVHDDSNEILY